VGCLCDSPPAMECKSRCGACMLDPTADGCDGSDCSECVPYVKACEESGPHNPSTTAASSTTATDSTSVLTPTPNDGPDCVSDQNCMEGSCEIDTGACEICGNGYYLHAGMCLIPCILPLCVFSNSVSRSAHSDDPSLINYVTWVVRLRVVPAEVPCTLRGLGREEVRQSVPGTICLQGGRRLRVPVGRLFEL